MDLRKHDRVEGPSPDFARTARFVETEDGWFFRTREGITLGPYEEKFDAEISASLLVARLAQLEPGADPAPVIQAFENDPANATRQNASRQQPADLAAIRRKRQINATVPTFQRAWAALSRFSAKPRSAARRLK